MPTPCGRARFRSVDSAVTRQIQRMGEHQIELHDLEHPLVAKISGKTGEGVILKPDSAE